MTPSPPQTPVPRHPTGAIPERLPLQIEQQPGEHLFIDHRIGFQTVGRHVIDRFDENQVGIDLVQVLDQRPVPRRTEKQAPCPSRSGVSSGLTANVSVEGFWQE